MRSPDSSIIYEQKNCMLCSCQSLYVLVILRLEMIVHALGAQNKRTVEIWSTVRPLNQAVMRMTYTIQTTSNHILLT